MPNGSNSGLVPERRRVVAAEAEFAGVADRLTVERRFQNLALDVPASGLTPEQQVEARLQAAAEVLDAAEAELAAVDAVGAHALKLALWPCS